MDYGIAAFEDGAMQNCLSSRDGAVLGRRLAYRTRYWYKYFYSMSIVVWNFSSIGGTSDGLI
jgi:hypothetical protein